MGGGASRRPGAPADAHGEQKIYIPVISKGFQHQFWQAVKQGRRGAAKQYSVEITFEGPPTEADIQPQVQMLVNAMAKNPSPSALRRSTRTPSWIS